jgi:hypothetical protein
MEIPRYATHPNMKNLKVNTFLFGLKFNIHAKLRILITQTLHNVVHKALIYEEELNIGGQGMNPSRPNLHMTSRAH